MLKAIKAILMALGVVFIIIETLEYFVNNLSSPRSIVRTSITPDNKLTNTDIENLISRIENLDYYNIKAFECETGSLRFTCRNPQMYSISYDGDFVRVVTDQVSILFHGQSYISLNHLRLIKSVKDGLGGAQTPDSTYYSVWGKERPFG